jgi:hypothetical protein
VVLGIVGMPLPSSLLTPGRNGMGRKAGKGWLAPSILSSGGSGTTIVQQARTVGHPAAIAAGRTSQTKP